MHYALAHYFQETWRDSRDKCTFIVLDRALYEESGSEESSMVGDTNLFLSNADEDDDGSAMGEAEIMIAEESARGKGLGWEAMLIMLRSDELIIF